MAQVYPDGPGRDHGASRRLLSEDAFSIHPSALALPVVGAALHRSPLPRPPPEVAAEAAVGVDLVTVDGTAGLDLVHGQDAFGG